MKVLVLESNLLWSSRLRKTLTAAGHDATVSDTLPENAAPDVAIVNLSNPKLDPFEAIRQLKRARTIVLGHAGHKEKELIQRGTEAGCDRVVSNGEITFKLPEILRALENEG